MKANDETIEWATEKLMRFSEWKGFPSHPEAIKARVRSFLRLVHGKPIRDLVHYDRDYVAACIRNGMEIPEIDWNKKGMDPDQNDADWILNLVAESMDVFPLPIQMRELYSDHLTPYSTFGEPSWHYAEMADKEA